MKMATKISNVQVTAWSKGGINLSGLNHLAHQAHLTHHITYTHTMSSSSASKRPSDQELTQTYNTMKSELSSLAQKIGELETEADEHS